MLRQYRREIIPAGNDQPEMTPNVFELGLEQQAPTIDDAHPVGNLFHLGEVMGREERCPALADVIFKTFFKV